MCLLGPDFMHFKGKTGIFDGKIILEIAYTNIVIYHIHHEIVPVETF